MAPKVQEAKTPKKLVGLPVLVVSPVDVGRLIRELDTIDDTILKAKLQKAGHDGEPKMPETSQLMDHVIQLNKLDLVDEDDRKLLNKLLVSVRQRAPVLHVSFSADPNIAFLEKLMVWLRREIHPLVLITVGLQPSIGAGCIVRSTNKYFDFSLRQDFEKKKPMLLEALSMPKTEPKAAESSQDVPA